MGPGVRRDIVRSFWGQAVTPGDLASGDASGDGFVGGDDLDIIRNHWGEGAEPARAPVPEPSILVLLLAGVSCLVVFPCRR